jgi:hypothetical protein
MNYMIAKSGAILVAIVILSFIIALLLMDMVSPYGFTRGSSLASFFNFLSGEEEGANCDCEFSSQLGEYICNTFCGELAGKSCEERIDCLK